MATLKKITDLDLTGQVRKCSTETYTDPDQMTDEGLYRAQLQDQGLLPAGQSLPCVAETLKSGEWTVQRVTSCLTGETFVRAKTTGAWSAWRKLG